MTGGIASILFALLAVASPSAARSAKVACPASAHHLVQQGGFAESRAREPEPPSAAPFAADKETLVLLRSVLADDGPEEARRLLEEIVQGLVEPQPGAELAYVAFLLELDRVAEGLGSLPEQRILWEGILAARTRLFPPDNLDLLGAKMNLARVMFRLGDFAGARELNEAVVEVWTRLLPPDNPDLLTAKMNLGATMFKLGDLAGARELLEAVHETRARLLPPDHHDLLDARLNLALTRFALGDLVGARELEEGVLEARTRLLPRDHPDLLAAKANLATTRAELGDHAGARELKEDVLEAWTSLLPPDHHELLAVKLNFAVTMRALGDLDGARELDEAVLEAWTRCLPPDHPDLLAAKQNLIPDRLALGDLAGARELAEDVLEACAGFLPPDHPDLLTAEQNLAAMRYALGDLAGTHELVSNLLAGMRLRARGLLWEAGRPARESARAELSRLSTALFLAGTGSDAITLAPAFFATLENLRLASVANAELTHVLAERPDLSEGARRVANLRSKLGDLVASAPTDAEAIASWRAELLRITEERDRVERELRRKLTEGGTSQGEIDAQRLGDRLASDEAVVSFLRYSVHLDEDPTKSQPPWNVDSLLAWVVQPGGRVLRVELGPATEVEDLVRRWRAALGRPLAARGVDVAGATDTANELEDLGRRLREHVLDPVLAAADEARTLNVVLDDALHLVPLDALPLEGGLVGERIAIRNDVTLSRLSRPRRGVAAEGGFVLAGGIDYDAELGAGAPLRLDAARPPSDPGSVRFVALHETRAEAEEIAGLYEDVFAREASILTSASASKAALHAAAPKARFLHLATHGWFASESFKSQLDSLAEQASRGTFEHAEATLTGFAPETLCGLALAGANRGKDALGRVPGILTAEELASFDFRNCELAVLSACETNVGIRRAGQGIQSLQTALHAAGARTAITSLWKVDDAATRRLFELFYTRLWKEHLGKAEALWQAKMALRAEGHPPRDWAGWVLSGDPG